MTAINETNYTNNIDDLTSLLQTSNIKKQDEIDLLLQRYNFLCESGNYISIDDLLETNLYNINEIYWECDNMHIKDMLEDTLQCSRDNVKNYTKNAYKSILIYLGYNVN